MTATDKTKNQSQHSSFWAFYMSVKDKHLNFISVVWNFYYFQTLSTVALSSTLTSCGAHGTRLYFSHLLWNAELYYLGIECVYLNRNAWNGVK